MSGSPARTATAEELFERRVLPLYHLADDSAAIAASCPAMAIRFHRGENLVAFGNGAASVGARLVGETFANEPRGLLAPEVIS